MPFDRRLSRRELLKLAASSAGVSMISPVVWAEELLTSTPRQTAGPFYPAEIPLDSDNDLVRVDGRSQMAKGTISNVIGRVLDKRGKAVDQAAIEIWQCDANGRYHHPGDRRDAPIDENFQGYGRFTTASDGAYRFRTIKPVSYPGRAPHIHFKVAGPGFEPLLTQMYVAGAPENEGDFLLNKIRDEKARASVLVDFQEDPDIEEVLIARFDVVLSGDGRYS